MASGWIDIHGHFSPPILPAKRLHDWEAARQNGFLLPEPWVWTISDTLKYLDEAGISLQFLSNIPTDFEALKASNDYGASIVARYPSRFGLLAAIPTDKVENSLAEIQRATTSFDADGFAVSCHYNKVYLSDSRLDPMWEELDRLKATVFVHPNAYAPPILGRPAPLIEVTFETCRTIVSMLYNNHFSRFPNINFIIAHCGGALPVLCSRLELLGAEPWVPNPHRLSASDIKKQLGKLYLDTAATCPSALDPALRMIPSSHLVYGSDFGVPCSREETMDANRQAILEYTALSKMDREAVGRNVLCLFPKTAARLKTASKNEDSID